MDELITQLKMTILLPVLPWIAKRRGYRLNWVVYLVNLFETALIWLMIGATAWACYWVIRFAIVLFTDISLGG